MNEAIFLIAVLYEKGILTKSESVALRDMAQRETFSASLNDMSIKINKYFKKAHEPKITSVDELNAKDIYKKG